MPYQRKTTDEYVLQINYGHGFEDVTCETTRKEIRERLKEYEENEPGYNRRIVKKLIPKQA